MQAFLKMAAIEYNFIEKPLKGFQFECPICLLVLREPYQATCCGKSFCKMCINQVKAKAKTGNCPTCPTCKTENFFSYPNKGLQQSLNDFEVYCSHKSKGCEWRGELRELDKHLNSDPPADKSLEGCPFTVIDCPCGSATCKMKQPRSQVVIHVNTVVLKGRVLEHIKLAEDQLRFHKNNHKLLKQVVRDKSSVGQCVEQLEMLTAALQSQVRSSKFSRLKCSSRLARIVMTNYRQLTIFLLFLSLSILIGYIFL